MCAREQPLSELVDREHRGALGIEVERGEAGTLGGHQPGVVGDDARDLDSRRGRQLVDCLELSVMAQLVDDQLDALGGELPTQADHAPSRFERAEVWLDNDQHRVRVQRLALREVLERRLDVEQADVIGILRCDCDQATNRSVQDAQSPVAGLRLGLEREQRDAVRSGQ